MVTRLDALELADAGFFVFPAYGIIDGRCACGDAACEHPGKHPACEHGFKDATRDHKQLSRWFFRRSDRNIAIATEASDLVVIDVDPRNGGDETWAAIVAEFGIAIEDTVQAATGGGGAHFYYKTPPGVRRIKSGSNVLGAGIDIKAAGGAVIAPPSAHISGDAYKWVAGHAPNDLPIADLPSALLERLLAKADGADGDNKDDTDGEPTGFDLLGTLDGLPAGQRQDALFRAACSFRAANTTKKVAVQLCTRAAAACTPPFPEKEAKKIVARVYRTYPPGALPHPDEDGYARVILLAQPGRLPWLVDQAEKILRDDHVRWRLYERGGVTMHVSHITQRDRENEKQIRRPLDALILRPATVPLLQDVLGRAIDWREPDAHAASVESSPAIDCPAKVASVLLSRIPALPSLLGVIEAPILRPDGTILDRPGYDAATGLLLDSSTAWLPVAELPTRAEVDAAVKTLVEPFREFPYIEEADLAVLVSAIQTGLQRRLLFAAPLHGFDAPAQGAGKTLQADAAAAIITGRHVAAITADPDPREMEKKLFSVLLAGDPIVLIDNITEPLESDALSTMLTKSSHKGRILGGNQIALVPTNTLFLASGNNLTFSGDLPTRAIAGRIIPRTDRPEERNFAIADLRAHVLDNRPRLVHAALTILRGYHAAGCPPQGLSPFGRFEQWSAEIRSAIVWAGLADPCRTRERIVAQDPERAATAGVLVCWHSAFGDTAVPLAHVIETATTDAPLRGALLEVAADRTDPARINPRRLGAWCRERVDRVVDGLILAKGATATREGAVFWRVVQASADRPAGYTADATLARYGKATEASPPTNAENESRSSYVNGVPFDANGSDTSESPEEKAENDRLARADGWEGPTAVDDAVDENGIKI